MRLSGIVRFRPRPWLSSPRYCASPQRRIFPCRGRRRPYSRRPRGSCSRFTAAARALRFTRPCLHPRRPRDHSYNGRHGHDGCCAIRVMILVCGGLADGVTELVCSRLQDCGYPYRLLDLARFPEEYRVSWRWTDGAAGRHRSPRRTGAWISTRSAGVMSGFLGPEDRPALPGLDAADAAALRGEGDLSLMTLFEDLPCRVVNRIGGGLSNNSKPYQALLISRSGLSVPPTHSSPAIPLRSAPFRPSTAR